MGAQKEEPRGQESEQALFGLVFISSLFIFNDITKGYIHRFPIRYTVGDTPVACADLTRAFRRIRKTRAPQLWFKCYGEI